MLSKTIVCHRGVAAVQISVSGCFANRCVRSSHDSQAATGITAISDTNLLILQYMQFFQILYKRRTQTADSKRVVQGQVHLQPLHEKLTTSR